ncbi:MAG: arylamine N-acetyltransferase [Actinomycetia bacterium]|nr:arylamine N-acetyltransferase [Actinomycetes bacterium]
MDDSTVQRYLARIGFEGPPVPDWDTLAGLQLAHLRSAPFENIDVVAGGSMPVDAGASVPKVADQERGGWCFELNGAFAALLEGVGFRVQRLPGLVYMGGTEASPMDDHLCLRVDLDRPWLVDVGFGDSFTQPLPLDSDEPVDDEAAGCRFRVTIDEGRGTLWSEHDESWRLDYEFALDPVQLSHFEPAAHFLSTNQDLDWSKKRFLTRLTDSGRVTLREQKLLVRTGREVEETEVESEEHWRALAREWFDHG